MRSRPKEITLLPNQEILVLVIILFAARIDTQDYVQEPDTTRKIPKLEDQIRRQLMKDNYDYLPSEEDALHTDRAEDALHIDRAEDALHTDRAEDALHTDRSEDALHTDRPVVTEHAEQDARTEADGEWENGRGRDDNGPQLSTTTGDDDFMIPTMRDFSKHKDKNKEKHDLGFIMSRKDLLYYIDDKRMRRAGHVSDNDVNNTSEGSGVEFDDIIDATKPDAKYKMIKVKEGEPTRRKSPPYRRFIQESNREGYSIIRLDDQPFPAFQLPRARRQYMGGPDSADGPLPDRGSDDDQQ